ncbi:MAG: restriction endonuclease [Sulfurospirillum sp.]|nr:restriction endonuclease [Sulfurospirillum sp.]
MKKEKNTEWHMQDNIKIFIKKAISELIKNTTNKKKIETLIKKHIVKIHFIPIRYRIFGGLLQSMNIQFGNFIEKLLHIIVANEKNINISEDISGKRNIKLPMTQKSESLIDKFIANCQNSNYNESELLENFNKLISKCLEEEQINSNKKISIKHDIDVLFFDNNDKYYYLEVKYNDDHDTGKYADINRKFIKSYIGVCNILKIYDISKFKPILYYLTKKKMKGNIYLPEIENIYRGDRLFNEFFQINYSHLDKIMKNIGDDKEIIELFDNLYKNIRFDMKF